ncbi:hypothetical protein Thena_0352 [Thermodesulfobium narugense DSM 14796]|uniref:Nitrogen regulatory protein P-II n=1 Tax=Thermodesulfobium narugense DSM 14796 TaxID=747365 RepID=M1E650_9BACT|nr:hypothetical protein [Thermodesulfobium narugense]AEE13998.1 hypothetical protein Thena_0352 [Thermodesulfobium narugense DSM 14796]
MSLVAMFLVVDNRELLPEFLQRISKLGISGATFFDCSGFGRSTLLSEESLFQSIEKIMSADEVKEKSFLFFVLEDSKLKEVKEIAEKIFGKANNPDTFFAFATDIKWMA